MNKPDWTVRIIAAPPGEAPLWVRQKWVGLDLPVTRYSGQSRFLGLGVLSMPRSWLGQWLAVIKGRYRFRLLVKSARGVDLSEYLREWLAAGPKTKGNLKLEVDVDPQSFL